MCDGRALGVFLLSPGDTFRLIDTPSYESGLDYTVIYVDWVTGHGQVVHVREERKPFIFKSGDEKVFVLYN